MSLLKQSKDQLLKFLNGPKYVPSGLFELSKYFYSYGPIKFDYKKEGDSWIGISNDFRFGKIISSGRDQEELESNIKDAILTSFDVPSSYIKESGVQKLGNRGTEKAYAIAK